MDSFGEYLKRQRELKEITKELISKKTKVKLSFIDALEKDQFEKLPPFPYVRGFVHSYAECLGLDPKEVILRLEEYIKERHPELIISSSVQLRKRAGPKKLILSLCVVSIVAILSLSYWYIKRPSALPLSAEKPSLPKSVSSNMVQEQKPEELDVRIKAKETSWIQATIDQERTEEAILNPPNTLVLKARKQINLIIGNAGGVEIKVNNQPLKPLGPPWKPVRILIPDQLSELLLPSEPPAESHPDYSRTSPR